MAELDDDEPLPLRVKNALRQLLKDGLPRKERVAEKFGMTVRTLQRHLQQAGSSYQQTLDELRRELAEHYLLHSELPIQDIAQYLGFTESRSFHRSFQGLDRADARRVPATAQGAGGAMRTAAIRPPSAQSSSSLSGMNATPSPSTRVRPSRTSTSPSAQEALRSTPELWFG